MNFASKAGKKSMKYNLQSLDKICIMKSSIAGRGVFAKHDIEENEIVEESHFIISGCPISMQDKELARYVFPIFFCEGLSEKEHEELTFKASMSLYVDDEDLKNEIRESLKDLSYKNFEDLFVTATVLGYGMIYNHAEKNNIEWNFNYKNFTFEYKSNTKIKRGEELFINYGPEYWKKHERITA